jgi:hypothetical protein
MDTMEPPHLFDAVEVGRRLGHDLYRLSPWPLDPDWPAPVREGYREADNRSSLRSPGDRFQRKWLQLRLGAWRRGRAVAADVTPALLRELDLTHCPVTRAPLTHGLQADTDASVDRLHNDGAYAAGNLALMSVRANRAKGTRSFDEVLAAAEGRAPAGPLSCAEWLRLAALMLGPSFATRPHDAPLLPLVAPLPVHALRLAEQQLQRLLTLQAGRLAGRHALVKALLPAAPLPDQRLRLQRLGDAVHQALKQVPPEQPAWDLWLQPAPMDALRQWQASLDLPSRARAAQIVGQLAGGRRVTPTTLRPWLLPSRGYAFPARAA